MLKDHAIEKKKAKDIIQKYSRNNSPQGVVSDRNSMRTTLNSQQLLEEAKSIHRQISKRGEAFNKEQL